MTTSMSRTLALASAAWLAACGGAAAQQAPCSPITVPAPGGAHILPGTRVGIAYARRNDEPLAFDIFTHADRAARPTAVILRGGSGNATIGDRLSFVGQIVETMAGAGYHVVLPDYRSSSAADASDDLAALVATLRCHAGDLGIDADRLVILGEHTGGDAALRLTRALSTERGDRAAQKPAPPRAAVALGGVYDNVPDTLGTATLLVHGGADSEVPVERPRGVCAAAGNRTPCDVLVVEDASHRIENWWPRQWPYKRQVVEWLSAHVGTVPPPSWPDDPRLRKEIVFDRVNGLTLDAYIPEGPGPFGAAILVHGGGWEAGDRVTYIAPMFQPLAARDIAWFSIDYRLTPQVTNAEQVADVERALAYVKAHAAEYRVDPSKIVLVGESASGQLVSHLATRGVDVAGVVSFYGVYDFLAMSPSAASPRSLPRRLFGITELDQAGTARLREYSPLYHVAKDMPPLLLVTGTADGLWKQAQAFEQALIKAGATFDTIVLPDAPHGMEQWNADPRWRSWSDEVTGWILKTLNAER